MPAPTDSSHDRPFRHVAGDEPIPGYRLLAPLGRGGFGEVWKCEAPGGLLKAIKFVEGNSRALQESAHADEELRAIQHVKSIRHPFILSLERVENVRGCLVVVSELADASLADVLAAAQADGRAGIPRTQLLAYLREAAEALDVMHVRHGLQHLDVKPQNLFLVSDHVKVGDFGLVQRVSPESDQGGVAPLAISPLYAPPEVFRGIVAPQSDQYSLAVTYQELLTGTRPFAGKNGRQLLLQHASQPPDLSSLPDLDRAVLSRALAKDPASRFPSCAEFVHALESGQTEVVAAPPEAFSDEARVKETQSLAGTLSSPETPAVGLHYRFESAFPPQLVLMRLAEFERQWGAQASASDGRRLSMQVRAPRCVWQRWTGEPPLLQVRFEVAPAGGGFENGTEVRLIVCPVDATVGMTDELSDFVGPLLAESVRTHLDVNQSRRTQERLAWLEPVRLREMLPDGGLGPIVECQGKDVSLNGIGFYVEGAAPATSRVLLMLPKSALTAQVSVVARVVRVKACGNGWHEIGAVLGPGAEQAAPEPAPAVTLAAPPTPKWSCPPWVLGTITAALSFAAITGWLRPTANAHPQPEIDRTQEPTPIVAQEVARPPEPMDLASAIAATPDGGVVLVRGTVRIGPLHISGKSLTLRGVAGTKPVIERLPGAADAWDALLSSDSALTIEGLSLRGTPDDVAPLVCVEGATLTLRDCRLTMPAPGPAVSLRDGKALTLCGCTIDAQTQALAVEVRDRACKIDASACEVRVQETAGAVLVLWAEKHAQAAIDVTLDVRGDAGRLIACRGVAGPVRVTGRTDKLTLRGERVSYSGYRDEAAQPAVVWAGVPPLGGLGCE